MNIPVTDVKVYISNSTVVFSSIINFLMVVAMAIHFDQSLCHSGWKENKRVNTHMYTHTHTPQSPPARSSCERGGLIGDVE